MEESEIPVIVEQLSTVLQDARQLTTGQYDQPSARRWFMKAIYWYRRLYGPKSASFTELLALRDKLFRGSADPAVVRAKANEFLSLVAFLQEAAASAATSRPSFPPNVRRIFVIHGHDELNTLRLQGMLKDQFGVEVIVITAKPGQSRPIIDKFEEYAKHCSFAIALFTPDDLVVRNDEKYAQARPNVIFETGWFVGRLGKERVIILLKEGTKIYSDFDGVSRIQFRDDVTDVFIRIQSELRAAQII